jgi:hypothetical protein
VERDCQFRRRNRRERNRALASHLPTAGCGACRSAGNDRRPAAGAGAADLPEDIGRIVDAAAARANLMTGKAIEVRTAFDREADVWWITASNLPGLHAEAATLDEMRDKLPGLIAELLAENEPDRFGDDEIVVNLIVEDDEAG